MALEYPYSEQAERAVLGSMIMDGDAVIIGVTTLYDDDFYNPKYQKIYKAIQNIYNRNIAVDITTLTNELDDMKCLEEIGGVPTLVDITENVVINNTQYYIDVLKDKTNLRRFAKFLEQTYNDFNQKSKGDVNEYLNTIEQETLIITRSRHIGGFQTAEDVINRLSEKISKNTYSGITGADTGYPALNSIIQGWQPGDLIILAARPGVGKSALALNFAYNTAKKTGKTVGFFSLEMPAEHMIQRMIAACGLIANDKLKSLNFDSRDLLKFQTSAKDLSKLKIFIDDTPGLKLLDVQDKARKLKTSSNDLCLIIIDYLNLLSIGGKNESRQQEVAQISRGLKALARELKVPVIALAQLSRDVEKRMGKSNIGVRPNLSDLRESGAIEQDADIVMFIYREDYYKKGDEEVTDDNVPVELIIDKHRQGARGKIDLVFSKSHSRFTGTNQYSLRREGDK